MMAVRRAAVKDLVIIGVAVVLLVFAGWYAWSRGDAVGAVPDDQFLSMKCDACEKTFEISHRDFEALEREGKFQAGGGGRSAPGEAAKSGGMLYECKLCEELAAHTVRGGG